MRIFFYFIIAVALSGCAINEVYDPLQSASRQTLLLNEGSLLAVKEGMGIDEVHQVMGQEIIIGYTSSMIKENTPQLAPDKAAANSADAYKPLTITNPYKSEELKIPQGTYLVEYYVARVHQPDGIIKDNELMPLVFKDEKLIGRGWPFLQALLAKE